MEIKPIKNKESYQKALIQIDEIFDAEPGTKDGNLLEVLSTLVEQYEKKQYDIPDADPIEVLNFLLESQRLTKKDLQKYIGKSNRISEILNRKRPLTLAMIRKLNYGLGIPADVLIREYELEDRYKYA